MDCPQAVTTRRRGSKCSQAQRRRTRLERRAPYGSDEGDGAREKTVDGFECERDWWLRRIRNKRCRKQEAREADRAEVFIIS